MDYQNQIDSGAVGHDYRKKTELLEQVKKLDESLLVSVASAMPSMETKRDSLGILGYEYIAFF